MQKVATNGQTPSLDIFLEFNCSWMAHILEKLEGEAVDCIRIQRFVMSMVNICRVLLKTNVLCFADASYPFQISEAL